MAEKGFELYPTGPYSLAASVKFLEGFAPAAYETKSEGHLHMPFVGDGSEDAVGVCVRSEGETILGEVFGGGDIEVVRQQVARILSLDVDGSGFPEVGKRDPVVGRLQERYPGLRPVCFYSPYEAAAWAIIGNRIRIVQAARIKARMAQELGEAVEIHGDLEHAFPAPSRLAKLEEFPGLFGRKVEYLRGIGRADMDRKLDARYLRYMPAEEASKGLKTLPGIGPFSAELVLLRGVGSSDLLPENESRLSRAVAMAYGLDELPKPDELRSIAEIWRPYRTWVSLHLRAMLEEETGEITGVAKTT